IRFKSDFESDFSCLFLIPCSSNPWHLFCQISSIQPLISKLLRVILYLGPFRVLGVPEEVLPDGVRGSECSWGFRSGFWSFGVHRGCSRHLWCFGTREVFLVAAEWLLVFPESEVTRESGGGSF